MTDAPRDEPLVDVRDLTVEFDTEVGTITVVDGVNLALHRGQTLGLVGESGSGKTVTSLAMLGLIGPPNGRVPRGEVCFDGRDLLALSQGELREVRGKEIGMIFQDPIRSLDPAFTVGDQIAEAVRAHQHGSRKEAWRRAVDMLDIVGIPQASRRAREYPHMFSGGMCQRVMLAMALACSPKVLIADEPTTALDVTVQAQILELLRSLQAEMGLSILFITHDLGVVAQMCDRVVVMYAGQVVEQASAMELFEHPKHPYTEGLLASVPKPDQHEGRLGYIAGTVPAAHEWPGGCRFHPRCPHVTDACAETVPDLDRLDDDRQSRCLYSGSLQLRGIR